jgi:hypothetical protein
MHRVEKTRAPEAFVNLVLFVTQASRDDQRTQANEALP